MKALKYLHDNDVVHRDIKPQYILIGQKKDDIREGDFGLSAYKSVLQEKKTGMCGAPNYASPEMVINDFVDGKCDIWVCGAMLFEMLTGRPPFHADTYERLWAKIKLAQFDVKCLQYEKTSIPARTLVMQMLTP